MTERLSQPEVDALIGAIRTGEARRPDAAEQRVRRPIRAYDFRRPDRFSKDQVRTLHVVHTTFARLTAVALSVQLRTPVSATLRSVDQLAYEEVVRSMAQPSVLLLFMLDPLEGKALLSMDSAFALLMVDRLLGGRGKPGQAGRPLTDVESTLISRVGEKILPALREAWQSIAAFTPSLVGIEGNPQFAQIASPGDIVLLITVEVEVPDYTGVMHLCLPYLVLQPVLGRLSATSLFQAAVHASPPDILRSVLAEATVPVRVELGRARVRLGELAELTRDDVIRLDRSVDGCLSVHVGDQATYLARPGQVRRRLAVEIVALEGEVHR